MSEIPANYRDMDREALLSAIAARKAELGETLCILGHHYQSDDVIQFSDYRGDSLKLSQIAGEQTADHIVFCGVHFMAESADILTSDAQTVCLPNLSAGCGMADMAEADAVAVALEEVAALAGGATIVPVTYVNSTAAIKAVTADWNGACCTSSNVRNVFEMAMTPQSFGGCDGDKIFAIPDQHLGRNTAFAMGRGASDCVVYDPQLPNGGMTSEQVRAATFILWKGWCYVHQTFTPEHVRAVRAELPNATVIAHPECPREVVVECDLAGSTAQIITAIDTAPAGSEWVVGTEANLVYRLAAQYPDKTIRLLGDGAARCVQMARIDLPHLLWCLDSIAAGEPINVITVDAETAKKAKLALDRMIAIKAVSEVIQIRPEGA
ncbi:MAG: quinolinate synthase NadA [Phycisphaerales bacterium]|nr:quinolinate synthase NadA [Phycisphaerales bacterium]